MKRLFLSFGLAVAVSLPAIAAGPSGGDGTAPQLSPFGEALQTLEADRAAFIDMLVAGVPERELDSYVAELEQMENHQLIQERLSEGGLDFESVAPQNLGTEGDYANMVYTALDAPCRVLDTRNYTTGGSTPIGAGVAREVWDWNISGQGGDAVCAAPLIGKSALVLALTAISPTFPSNFPTISYATLLNGSEMGSGWSSIAALPTVHWQYTYNTPPYNDAVSVVWDKNAAFSQTLAVVTRQSSNPEVVLYSNAQAHFAMDVVGYYEDPDLCPANTTFIDGLCWGPQQAAKSWFDAVDDCSSEGGQLPTGGAVNGAVQDGDLPVTALWGAGWYHDGTTFRGQKQSNSLIVSTTTTSAPYRCVFTPLTAP
jgi:hypothetical protein